MFSSKKKIVVPRTNFIKKFTLGKATKSVNKTAARKALKGNSEADVKGLLKPEEKKESEVPLKRYIANNASYEALGELLMENPNGLLVEMDELIGLLSSRSESDIELLYLWCKKGWQRSVLGEYHTQKQALSRFFIGAMLQSEPVLDVIRRELRRVSPDVRIDTEQIKAVLSNEVIKREVLEGEKAVDARKKIARSLSKSLRATHQRSEAKAPESANDTE